MAGVQFYRDADVPFFELKVCDASRLCYKKHAHEEYSLGVIEAGSSTFWYQGRTMGVNPETAVVIPPGLVHSCNPQPQEQWKYKMLFVEADWIRRFLQSKGLAAWQQPVVTSLPAAYARHSLHAMLTSLGGPAGPLEKEASLMAVFEQLLQDLPAGRQAARDAELPQLEIVREYLKRNFLCRVTLAELEAISGLNKFTLIRAFKEAFSVPPHTYQTLLRINQAKKLLRQNSQITDVAYATGFYDQSHFHKVFKSHTGVTPEQYKCCGS